MKLGSDMSANNPFEALADAQISSPVKARMRAVEKRNAKQAAKEDEESKLLKLYRRSQRQDVRNLLSGPFGADVRELMKMLRRMDLSSGPELVRYVDSAVWIKALPSDHKWIVLRMVSRAMTRVREANGLSPFDDPLPGEPEKAFGLCKKAMGLK